LNDNQDKDSQMPAEGRNPSVPFVEALKFWFKLGFISFGGPAGQISVMHQELVERRRWLSENRFLHALNYCMLLPGPEAQQLAAYTGWLFHGVKGGLIAGTLFVLPSFFIITSLAWVYLLYDEVPIVQAILYGIKPAVTAIVLFSAYRIGSRAIKTKLHWLIAVAAFLAIALFKVPFPYIVLVAGIIGLLAGRWRPDFFNNGEQHGSTTVTTGGSFIIDDDSLPPAHAIFKWQRALLILFIGVGVWVGIMAVLTYHFGFESTLTQMGLFFSKAAMVTIGGAYAVLPYVYQGGVETFGWVTPTQMIDGLALGETTPGPLIMIVTFVGFVGGWTKEIFGSEALLTAGFAAATVTTVFTFLPSFLFILVGGPLVEATRDNLKFTAPLSGITAAVVGVILNLALFFAYHVLWPKGFDHNFEWSALAIGLLAFIGLIRFKMGVIQVIGLSALFGLFVQLLI
jgi:chromate transporter